MQVHTTCSIDINVQQTSAAIVDISNHSNMIATYSSKSNIQQHNQIHSSRSNIHSSGLLQHPCEAAAAHLTGRADLVLLANEVEYGQQSKGKKKRTGMKQNVMFSGMQQKGLLCTRRAGQGQSARSPEGQQLLVGVQGEVEGLVQPRRP